MKNISAVLLALFLTIAAASLGCQTNQGSPNQISEMEISEKSNIQDNLPESSQGEKPEEKISNSEQESSGSNSSGDSTSKQEFSQESSRNTSSAKPENSDGEKNTSKVSSGSEKQNSNSKQESSASQVSKKQNSNPKQETSTPSKQNSNPKQESSSSQASKASKPVQAQSNTSLAVASISLNKRSLTMTVGEKTQLTAALNPSNADDQRITWYWSDSAVISIDSNGYVTALGAGKATVTVKTPNGKEDTCEVTVRPKTVSKPQESPVKPSEPSKPAEASKPVQQSSTPSKPSVKPTEPSQASTSIDPRYAAYYAPYDFDAIIADLRHYGETEYNMVWEDSLWVRNRGNEYGSKYDEEWGFQWATDEKGNRYYQGNCQFGFPVATSEEFDGFNLRDACQYMFYRLKKRLAKNDERIDDGNTLFKIVVEDIGLNSNGDQDYWIYLLYS